MPIHDPIAYTHDGEVYCPGCASVKFGVSDRGFIGEDVEGVGVIAPWDE
jgi:hypothetical protein